MATFDTETGRFLLTPDDHDGQRRAERLHALGLDGREAVPEFDAFATDLARAAAALVGSATLPFTMVNFIDAEQNQFFAGLHAPVGPDGKAPEVDRNMDRDHGYCVHVLDRGHAMVLNNVDVTPRYASNGVTSEIGVSTYLGAPLFDEATGTAIGTICVVDTQPRPWNKEGLDLILKYRDELQRYINSRIARH